MIYEITESDLRILRYFWHKTGDVKRWSEWAEKIDSFKKEYPELIAAIERYDVAEKTLDIIIDNLELKQDKT